MNKPCEDCPRNCEEPCWKIDHGLLEYARGGMVWVCVEEINAGEIVEKCSACGEVVGRDKESPQSNYCPNCGRENAVKEEKP